MSEHTIELLPCPFCGGKASATGVIRYHAKHEAWFSDGTRVLEAFFCNCLSCGIDNKGLLGHQTQEKAIAAWNRRSYATALCQQGEPTEELGTLFDLVMYGDRGNPEKLRREIARLLSLYSHAHAERDAKDAARYRWLRAKWHRIEAYTDHDSHALVMQVHEFGGTLADNERLDAAIDAALSTSKGKTE